jgi:hypothetical protein
MKHENGMVPMFSANRTTFLRHWNSSVSGIESNRDKVKQPASPYPGLDVFLLCFKSMVTERSQRKWVKPGSGLGLAGRRRDAGWAGGLCTGKGMRWELGHVGK